MKIYISMNPNANIGDVKKECQTAKDGEYSYICLPQWFVSPAADELDSSKTDVATIIGLPGGTTSSYAKFAEAKQAIANGARLIIIPINMSLCEKGDFAAAKNDLSSALVACKTINGCKRGAKAAVLIDGADLDENSLKKAVELCSDLDVCSVFIAHNKKAVEAFKKDFPAVEEF